MKQKQMQAVPLSRRRKLLQLTPGQIAGKLVVYGFLLFIFIVTFFPFWQIFVLSINDAGDSLKGGLLLWPRELNFSSYKAVFQNEEILSSLGVTVTRTVIGVPLTVFCVAMLAYVLSKTELVHRRAINFFFVFTMYFSGGLIPTYMVVSSLHMVNTRTVLVVMGTVTVYNMIIARTFFQNSLPEELFEAAELDGCGVGKFFFKIALPCSKAIIAVIALYVGVSQWNSYFTAMIYVTDQKIYPLQLVLRDILILGQQLTQITDPAEIEALVERQKVAQIIKYVVIIVSSLPVICVYPFLQKYFVKGVMIGSVKG